MIDLKKIEYKTLKGRQKESYNYQKVSAILADYGFATIKLTDDWDGTDFIAQHFKNGVLLKVQLKSRLTFHEKYSKKDLWICFPDNGNWYLYKHDDLLEIFLNKNDGINQSKSWSESKSYTYPRLSKKNQTLLKKYKL